MSSCIPTERLATVGSSVFHLVAFYQVMGIGSLLATFYALLFFVTTQICLLLCNTNITLTWPEVVVGYKSLDIMAVAFGKNP